MNDIDKRIVELREELVKATAAEDFQNTDAGRLAVEYVEERISYLINRIAGALPVEERDYLASHGAIKELRSFHTMLMGKPAIAATIKEELDGLLGAGQE